MQDVRLSHLSPAQCAGFFFHFIRVFWLAWDSIAILKAVDNFGDNSAPG